jgi:hypothetical protein
MNAIDLTGNGPHEIYLQELSGAMAQGYLGHDQFYVEEGCLVHRSPI